MVASPFAWMRRTAVGVLHPMPMTSAPSPSSAPVICPSRMQWIVLFIPLWSSSALTFADVTVRRNSCGLVTRRKRWTIRRSLMKWCWRSTDGLRISPVRVTGYTPDLVIWPLRLLLSFPKPLPVAILLLLHKCIVSASLGPILRVSSVLTNCWPMLRKRQMRMPDIRCSMHLVILFIQLLQSQPKHQLLILLIRFR